MTFREGLFIDIETISEVKLKSLARYVAKQLDNLFPTTSFEFDADEIAALLPEVINRLRPILRAVRFFDSRIFNYLHSHQYAIFLYLLANEEWSQNSNSTLSDRLFCLNRALNSIDLFYSVPMPEIFCLAHGGLGSVLGNASYGERLIVFQNVTIGRVGEARPEIGNNVVIYPGSVITGNTTIGDNSVISAGLMLHNREVPAETVVIFDNGQIIFKPRKRNYSELYFE